VAIGETVGFEVSRPVIEGAEDFLAIANYAGRLISEDTSSGLVVPDEYAPSRVVNGEDGLVSRDGHIIGRQRYRVYSELRLPILEWGAPGNLNHRSDFSSAVGKLSQRKVGEGGASERVHTVHSEVKRIGLKYDVPGEDSPIKVDCRSIIRTQSAHKPGYELALVPEPDSEFVDMFIEEHQAYLGALRKMARFRHVKIDERYTPLIPFMSFEAGVEPREIRKFVARLEDGDGLVDVGLTLGGVLDPILS
jgi:hypothetical protein